MSLFEMELRRDQNGRIVEKIERVKGRAVTWTYSYDAAGRLFEAHLDGRLLCQCYYDKACRRSRDYLPATAGPNYRDYRYTLDNRLLQAGNNTNTHDDNGFRSIWSSGDTYTVYDYVSDYRLRKMEMEDTDRVFEYRHDEEGNRPSPTSFHLSPLHGMLFF